MNITYKKHVPSLDGVRGIAVLVVMFYHFAHVHRLGGSFVDGIFYGVSMLGWMGVDLFFTLSGFLITGILLDTKKSGNYFSSFYARRTLRIFPLYYGYLIFLFFIFYPMVYAKTGAIDQAKIDNVISNQHWFWFYLSNIKQVISDSFFSGGVGHLWSLAIEEQFYVIWPLVVFLTSKRTLKAICYSLLLIPLLVRCYMVYKGFSADSIYVFTLSRVDALVAGALLALLVRTEFKINSKVVYRLFLGFPLLLFIFIAMGSRMESNVLIYTVGFSLLAFFFALLILIALDDSAGKRNGWLSSDILVFFGKYSYALYIFHPLVRSFGIKIAGDPVLLFDSQIPWQLGFSMSCLVVTIGLALISWHLYEKHFLKLKTYFVPVQNQR